MIGLVFWKDTFGCCMENGLEMGSHRDRNQPGDWRLSGVKTGRLKDGRRGGMWLENFTSVFFF